MHLTHSFSNFLLYIFFRSIFKNVLEIVMRFKVTVCSLDNIGVSEMKLMSWDLELMNNLNKDFFYKLCTFHKILIP